MSVCPNCFHVVGEHLLCRDHGGESGFTVGAYRQAAKVLDCPHEPTIFQDEWWSFLDAAVDEKGRKLKQILPEVVP